MATSLEIQPAVPGEFMTDEIISTSQAILRKELIPIFPENNSTFKPGTNSEIRIHIDDQDSYLFADESYLKFTFTLTFEGAAVTGKDKGYLQVPEGGIGSIFRDVELRINKTSVQLDRWEYFNYENVISKLLTDDPDVIDSMGYSEGEMKDTYSKGDYLVGGYAFNNDIHSCTLTPTNYVFPSILGDLGYMESSHTRRPAVGDVLSRLVVNNNVYTEADLRVVTGIQPTSNDGSGAMRYELSEAVADGDSMVLIDRDNPLILDHTTQSNVFTCKIPMGAMKKNWPLFLLPGGLNLILRLADFQDAVNTTTTSAKLAPTNLSYEISNVQFMAMLVTPHVDLKNKAIDDFNGNGMIFGFEGIRSKLIPINDQSLNMNLDVNWGLRSARKVVSYLVGSGYRFSDGYARWRTSIAQQPKAGITRYQYKVGIHFFPRRELDTSSTPEMLRQIYNSCGRNKVWRIKGQDLRSGGQYVDAAGAVFGEAKHFLMIGDLSRNNGEFSDMTGIDLSIAHLQLETQGTNSWPYQMGTAAGNLYVMMHVFHDKYVRLHATNISVIQ